MKTITFQIPEGQEADLHGGRLARLEAAAGSDEVSLHYIVLDEHAPGGRRHVTLHGKLSSVPAAREKVISWDSEEGRKLREEARVRYEEFRRTRGL